VSREAARNIGRGENPLRVAASTSFDVHCEGRQHHAALPYKVMNEFWRPWPKWEGLAAEALLLVSWQHYAK
jgi:hypothetical protein